MVSKNNVQERLMTEAQRRPHYGLRKLSVGVASVLLGTTLYFGQAYSVHADTVSGNSTAAASSASDTKSAAPSTATTAASSAIVLVYCNTPLVIKFGR